MGDSLVLDKMHPANSDDPGRCPLLLECSTTQKITMLNGTDGVVTFLNDGHVKKWRISQRALEVC